jgi:hypothetical protein
MNIFILHPHARLAARMLCDKHCSKMIVETAQMMAAGLIAHGAQPHEMPLTKSGTPYRGGYANHPCTRWSYESRENFVWLAQHGDELCREFSRRYGKVHACQNPIGHMAAMLHLIPNGPPTPFAQAMPDEFRDADAVVAYRAYYHSKTFAKWEKGTPAPTWFKRD